MPRGSKASYTDKQIRQAKHIESSEKSQGRSTKVAERYRGQSSTPNSQP